MKVEPSGIWKLYPRLNQTCGGPQFSSWCLGWFLLIFPIITQGSGCVFDLCLKPFNKVWPDKYLPPFYKLEFKHPQALPPDHKPEKRTLTRLTFCCTISESGWAESICKQKCIICTSSDEPFSTLKRPALCMAPSASLEISWEGGRDMFKIRHLINHGLWLVADSTKKVVNTSELVLLTAKRGTMADA